MPRTVRGLILDCPDPLQTLGGSAIGRSDQLQRCPCICVSGVRRVAARALAKEPAIFWAFGRSRISARRRLFCSDVFALLFPRNRSGKCAHDVSGVCSRRVCVGDGPSLGISLSVVRGDACQVCPQGSPITKLCFTGVVAFGIANRKGLEEQGCHGQGCQVNPFFWLFV